MSFQNKKVFATTASNNNTNNNNVTQLIHLGSILARAWLKLAFPVELTETKFSLKSWRPRQGLTFRQAFHRILQVSQMRAARAA